MALEQADVINIHGWQTGIAVLPGYVTLHLGVFLNDADVKARKVTHLQPLAASAQDWRAIALLILKTCDEAERASKGPPQH